MTSAQVVETSVTNNSSFQNYPHPDDHTIRTKDQMKLGVLKSFATTDEIKVDIVNIQNIRISVK